jgi:hypothetical protein
MDLWTFISSGLRRGHRGGTNIFSHLEKVSREDREGGKASEMPASIA